jgi:23S rRNA (uracil1939-C5)-methyltransferase
VEPVCPLYGRCGGCSLQHLNYETQVKVKKDILHDTFVRIGGINPPDIPVRFSVPFEYRNRVQFHRSNTRPCFRERKSSTPVFLDDCPVADAGIRRALKEGTIIPPPNKDRFNVYSRFNTFLSEGGAERGRVSILDRELAMDAGVFFQSNAAMLESLINDLAALASTADKDLPLADLYCGVGTFAAFLGPGFAGVDLVEENRAALELARENVNGKNLNCHALSAENWVNSIKTKKKHWGLMILDPPREGLSGPLREWLAGNGPELAAYVSCDPAALARDSKVLLEGGYVLRGLSLYDFYPQTAHVESLAVFSRRDNET